MITLIEASAIGDFIANLGKKANEVQADIHVAACSCLDHVREHGDTTGMVKLFNALPNGQRVKGLAAWVSNFSSKKLIMAQDDNKVWVAKLASKHKREDTDFNISGACEVTFADFSQERDPVSMTVERLIKTLKRNATNTETHADGITPKVTPEARDAASKLYQAAIDLGLVGKAA
jgi:hypothetical protein